MRAQPPGPTPTFNPDGVVGRLGSIYRTIRLPGYGPVLVQGGPDPIFRIGGVSGPSEVRRD
jgi:hypothetical protein